MAETTREELNEIRSRALQDAYDAANPEAAGLVARATAGHDEPDVVTSAVARGLLGTGSPGSGNFLRGDGTWSAVSAVTDGDKGDISISGGVWTIDNGVVSTAKMGGDVTTAGKALLDDSTAADQRTTLGLAAVAASGSASDLGTGTLPIARIGANEVDGTKLFRGSTAGYVLTSNGSGSDPSYQLLGGDGSDSVELSMASGRRQAGWAAGLGTTITAISHYGLFTGTLGGTGAAIGNASATDGTAVATGAARKRFTSTATANRSAELLVGSTFIGAYISGLAGFGGFFCEMRFAPGITNPVNKRGFYGFTDSGSALSESQSPSALVNCFGFGFDAAETNFFWQHNDGSGSATRVDLGSDFPTRDSTALFTARIWCEPDTSEVNYWIKNETTQDIASGAVSTDIPADGLGLAPHLHQNNGGSAAITEWDFAYMRLLLP